MILASMTTVAYLALKPDYNFPKAWKETVNCNTRDDIIEWIDKHNDIGVHHFNSIKGDFVVKRFADGRVELNIIYDEDLKVHSIYQRYVGNTVGFFNQSFKLK